MYVCKANYLKTLLQKFSKVFNRAKLKTEIPIPVGLFFISVYKNLFPNFEPIKKPILK